MKAKDFVVVAENHNNPYQHSNRDEQIVPQENSIYAYHQNGELSSKETDSQQKEDTSSQLSHYNVLDDTFAQLRSGSKTVTIPDDLWKEIMDEALKGGHPDNPGEKGHIGV